MTVVTTPGYEIYSSVSERRTRDVLDELGSFHQLLETSMNRKALPEPIPTRILLISRADWRRFFGARKDLAGLFVPYPFTNYLLIDAGSSRDEYMPTIFHEYTHYFLLTQFPGDYPAWFDEGLAEVLSSAKFRGGAAHVEPIFGHVNQVRSGPWLPTSTVLRVDRSSAEYTEHRLAASFYAQSWLFMYYALIQNDEFGGNVFRYITALNRPGTAIDQAVTEHFGDEKRLDELMRKFSRADNFKVGRMPLGKRIEPKLEPPRTLTNVETTLAIADAAISIGLSSPEVIELIDAVIGVAPPERKTQVHALRAQAAVMTSDEASAVRHMKLATENLATSNIEGYNALARILLTQATTQDGEEKLKALREARSLYEAARKLDGNDLQACWGFGLTSLNAGIETRAATEALAACLERAPRHAELNYAAAVGYSITGDLQRMRDHLVYAIRYSRDPQTRAELRNTLSSVDDRLRAEGRLAE